MSRWGLQELPRLVYDSSRLAHEKARLSHKHNCEIGMYKTEIGTGERNTDLVVISRNGRRTNTIIHVMESRGHWGLGFEVL